MGWELRETVGFADSCELMAAAFAFPTRELVEALREGSFFRDQRECLADLGLSFEPSAVAGTCDSMSFDLLFGALRASHTALFLLPGGESAVWPYETAFRHSYAGRTGMPALFLSPCQLDVERHMREAGVIPTDARREPSDSVWNEFSFLSFLYGNVAAAMYEDRDEDVKLWRERIAGFWREHGSAWLPTFMEQTRFAATDVSGGEFYAAFAEIGQRILEAIAMDVEGFTAPVER